jgi:hypothetical protein
LLNKKGLTYLDKTAQGSYVEALWNSTHFIRLANEVEFKVERIQKDKLSLDCSLQLKNIKLESLVIVNQHAVVNMYSGLVGIAHHTMETGFARSIKPRIIHYFSVLRRW